jgi:hypothetical protein
VPNITLTFTAGEAEAITLARETNNVDAQRDPNDANEPVATDAAWLVLELAAAVKGWIKEYGSGGAAAIQANINASRDRNEAVVKQREAERERDALANTVRDAAAAIRIVEQERDELLSQLVVIQ